MKTTAPNSDAVRATVMRTFAELSAEPIESPWLGEMILISDGHYLGRSYRAAGMLAVWLAEFGLVQIYGPDGQMLRTINLFAEPQPSQMAA